MIISVNGTTRAATQEEIFAISSAIAYNPPPTTEQQTVTLARAMAASVTTLSDTTALAIPDLLPVWEADLGKVLVGQCCRYGDKTYRCRQEHTTQAEWTPDKTPAMWVVIEPKAAGTKSDPITAAKGMEYEYGKYYKDPEDNKLYLCKREGESDGNKVVLQYLPHEVVNQYFVLVDNA